MKKDSGLLDMAIGAFDGAEVCELVGNFLLHKLSEQYERKYLALYLVDGIAFFKNVNRPDSGKIKKHFRKLFIDDLEITIQCNRKVVNFLDNTLNLENSTYHPYCPYVNTESNHPPSIIKQLPKSVELRLSQLSTKKELLKNSFTPCNKALTKAGYKHNMRFQKNITQNTTTNKNRKEIYYGLIHPTVQMLQQRFGTTSCLY